MPPEASSWYPGREKEMEERRRVVAQIVAAEAAGPLGMSASTLRVAECILRVVAPNPLPQPHAMHAGCHQSYGLSDEARNTMTDLEAEERWQQIHGTLHTLRHVSESLPQRTCVHCDDDGEFNASNEFLGRCLRWVTDDWVTVEGVSLATKRTCEGMEIEDAIASITPPAE